MADWIWAAASRVGAGERGGRKHVGEECGTYIH